MSDGTQNNDGNRGSNSSPDPDEAALSARLGSLNERLSKTLGDRKLQADQSNSESGSAQHRASAMAVGLRLSSELVAGVIVGTILGWVFDRLLSTSPWGLIVFLLLGFTAGVMNVMRSAGVGKKS